MTSRESLLTETFVKLADTLVSDFDVVDFFSLLADRCVELFGAGDAGLMLVDRSGSMQVVASSSHQMHLLELFEIQHDEGPCPDSYRSGQPVRCADLNEALERWPRFAPEALQAGFHSAHALPLRLRKNVIGALNLLCTTSGPLDEPDLRAAQALADVATIGLLQHRAAEESRLLSDQLQYALSSRIAIEQAKGVIAERLGIKVDEAFHTLRQYARGHNLRLADLAQSVVRREVDVESLVGEQH